MARLLFPVLVVASLGLAACDESKTPSVGDKLKDAGKAAGDKLAGAADAAKNSIMDALKPQIDAVKAKIETLTKGASSVKEADKAAYDKDLTDINSGFKTLTDSWDKLKSSASGDWTKLGDTLKTEATALLGKINAALTKYGIK